MIYGIERIVQKNEKVNRWVKGEPSVLIKDGVINMTELANNHIEMEQLRAILRQQECFSLEKCQTCYPRECRSNECIEKIR